MFTPIDKNLLIAALESAIYHACRNANVVSLQAIETGVSALRQRFDATPESVSDDDIFRMVETIERATIPALSHISAIDDDTNIADRVVSFLWKNIVGTPKTFPPSTHQHPWSEVTYKPSTFPPATHTHQAADITDMPATGAADWATLANKPTTFPPATHTHKRHYTLDFYFPGNIAAGMFRSNILPTSINSLPMDRVQPICATIMLGMSGSEATRIDLQRLEYGTWVSLYDDPATSALEMPPGYWHFGYNSTELPFKNITTDPLYARTMYRAVILSVGAGATDLMVKIEFEEM